MSLLRDLAGTVLDGAVPSRRAPAWAAFRRKLREQLPDCSGLRSWQAIYTTLHLRPAPRQVTWRGLLGEFTIEDLRARGAGDAGGARVAFWNLRWILGPGTRRATAKRAVILRQLEQGRAVVVQETHWDDAAAGIWQAIIPCGNFISSQADGGDHQAADGRRPGGVAILLPEGWELVEKHEAWAGYLLACRAKTISGGEVNIGAVYLPPGGGEEAARRLHRLPNWDGRWLLGGDFNVDLSTPRDPVDAAAAASIEAWAAERGLVAVGSGGNTLRKANGGSAAIDWIFMPSGEAGRSSVSGAWYPGLSDHALLTFGPEAQAAAPQRCSPFRLAALPPEAWEDLRRGYLWLAGLFGVSINGWPAAAADRHHEHAGPREEFPADDIAWEAAGGREQRRPPEQHHGGIDGDGLISENMELMIHGRLALDIMVRRWWERWRKSGHDEREASIGQELRGIFRGNSAVALSDDARQWLRLHGWDGGELPADQAGQWLAVWAHDNQGRRGGGPDDAPLGRAAKRRPVPEWLRLGRRWHKPQQNLSALQRADGTITTDRGEALDILWESRRGVWADGWAASEGSQALLELYGERRIDELEDAMPTRDQIVQRILAAGGSAAGADGTPYEVYHAGVGFVAALVGQAFWAARRSEWHLRLALGPNIELLIWIPKRADALTAEGQRPLQLPTCLRRLVEAVATEIAAPIVEPTLSRWQAARRRGSCRENVRTAVDFLTGASEPAVELQGDGEAAVRGLLGPFADAWRTAPGGSAGPQGRAALLVDQSKAFERLAPAWLDAVLQRRKAPRHFRRLLLAFVTDRIAAFSRPNGEQTSRRILTGAGMGGPAKPMCWNIGFDPIVAGLGPCVRAANPTFVDDLLALVRRLLGIWRASLFILAAAKAAGLHIDLHTCRQTVFSGVPGKVAWALSRLMLDVREVRPGCWRVAGAPHGVVLHLLTAAGYPDAPAYEDRQRCKCKVKTEILPATNGDEWRVAAENTPFGGTAVTDRARYLGCTLATPAWHSRLVPNGKWETPAIAAAREGTWAGGIGKVTSRASIIGHAQLPAAARAQQWNTFGVSPSVYPAQFAAAAPAEKRLLALAYRTATGGWRWAPDWAPASLQLCFGIRGAARCPCTVADAVTMISARAGQAWSCAALSGGGQGPWRQVCSWAARRSPAHPAFVDQERLQQRWTAAAVGPDIARAARTLARDAYGALWLARHQAAASTWLRTRARSRRWWRTGGEECSIVQSASGITAATHVLRLVLGGVRGSAMRRDKATRHAAPRRCIACGAAGPRDGPEGDTFIGWLTPGEDSAGIGWCHRCLEPALARRRGGAWVARACGIEIGANDGDAPPAAWAEHWRPGAHPDGACPLCGMGEMSSEHLLVWCPAVHVAAIGILGGAPLDREWASGGGDAGVDRRLVCELLHQTSFLAHALEHRATVGAARAAGRLVAAIRLGREHGHEGDPAVDGDAGGDCDGRLPGGEHIDVWHDDHHCPECGPTGNGFCRQSSVRCPDTGRCAGAAHHLASGEIVKSLWAGATTALWPLADGRIGPAPRPSGPSCPSGPNCRWAVQRCRLCGRHRADLIATRAVEPGEALCSIGQAPVPDRIDGWDLLITTDGCGTSARHPETGGGGVAIWTPETGGGWRTHAQWRAQLDGGPTAQEAEAHATAAALRWLAARREGGRRALVAGDCEAVACYCNGSGRLAAVASHDILDGPLAAAAATGWRIDWRIIPRGANQVAHGLADEGRDGRGAGWITRPGA